MKGLKALETILINSSTNSNLEPRHLSGNSKLINLYRQNVSLLFNQTCLNELLLPNHTHTHTHTHIYIYIYEQNSWIQIHGKDQYFKTWLQTYNLTTSTKLFFHFHFIFYVGSPGFDTNCFPRTQYDVS